MTRQRRAGKKHKLTNALQDDRNVSFGTPSIPNQASVTPAWWRRKNVRLNVGLPGELKVTPCSEDQNGRLYVAL
eukprot:1018070-Amphidinium_carterae.1